MKTSYKKGQTPFQNCNKNSSLNATPFTPRKQLNFTSQKGKKYDISCSQKEQDRENLKNNLLLTYIECQNCPANNENHQMNFPSKKMKSPIILNKLKNHYPNNCSNELIVSVYY
jgi:hypothetical protein